MAISSPMYSAGPAATQRSPRPTTVDSRPVTDRTASSCKDRRPKVLVGDDARALLLLMTTALQADDFEVATASTGRHAIERAREFEPDIVLLDIGMPEMDGIAACRVIRRESDNPNLPIVMVTGSDDEAAIHRAFEAGATGFITKPFDWSNFTRHIHAFLSGRPTEGEPRAKPAETQDTNAEGAPSDLSTTRGHKEKR